jgi:hypothetical protein
VLFGQVSPAFIPISAVHMRLSVSASLMSLEQFQPLTEMIEKLGRPDRPTPLEQTIRRGRSRRRTEILSDPSEHEEGLKDSNFDKFLSLAHFVGGEHRQRELIESQIKTSMRAPRSGGREELQTMCFPLPDD